MTTATGTFTRTWKHSLSIATAFWSVSLLLASIEATIGYHWIVAALFFLAIPTLVGFLAWANRDMVLARNRSMASVLVLGLAVLCSASVIILVGLLAAANLKSLITGA